MIGVIVEGVGEIPALESYLKKVVSDKCIATRPFRADLQPKANPRVIATSAKSVVSVLLKRGVEKIVVLIDLEDKPCPIKFSEELRKAFSDIYSGINIVPVIKNSSFENWMIADPDALTKMPGRFRDVKTHISNRVVNHDDADKHADAIRLLNKCSIKTEYHKTQDPPKVAAKQDINNMICYSRSFRKFMVELGHKPALNYTKPR